MYTYSSTMSSGSLAGTLVNDFSLQLTMPPSSHEHGCGHWDFRSSTPGPHSTVSPSKSPSAENVKLIISLAKWVLSRGSLIMRPRSRPSALDGALTTKTIINNNDNYNYPIQSWNVQRPPYVYTGCTRLNTLRSPGVLIVLSSRDNIFRFFRVKLADN